MTVDEQVLCALRFYATGSFQGSVGSDRAIDRHQSTVSRCVRNVSEAIVETAVRLRWVAFPATPAEREVVKLGFLRCGNLPGVVGCVDGTYIGIRAPSKRNARGKKATYFTRKGHYALNTMVVSISVVKCFVYAFMLV